MDATETKAEIKAQAQRQERDREMLAILLMLSLGQFFDHIKQIAARANPGFQIEIKQTFDQLREATVQTSMAAFQKARRRVLEQAIRYSLERPAPILAPDATDQLALHADPTLLLEDETAELLKKYEMSAGDAVQTLYEFVIRHAVVDSPAPAPSSLILALEKMGLLGDKSLIRALADTLTHDAYIDGLLFEGTDPAIKEIFKGWEYVSMRDDRVRPRHVEEDGKFATPENTTLLAQFKKLLRDWGCRCTLVAIFGQPEKPPILI